MKKDLPDLISSALAVLEEDGILWFSVNSHRMGNAELEARVTDGMQRAGRPLTLLETGGLPPDYPTPLAFPEGRYLKLRVFRA